MIGGISALQFKPAIGGADVTTGLLSGGAAPVAGGDIASSFSQALADAANKTVGTMQNAEHLSIQGLKGDVDTREVVDAVMNAQQALQTAVAIRDKIVSAYLDVSRMSI
ncbi:MAG TPA: flagellar hook-basal body complex protein FliE [Mesorhizobium sp.]